MQPEIYLNNAGTSWPKPPPVHAAVAGALDASPSEYARIHDRALEVVGRALHLSSTDRLLFTSGCTAALDVALSDLALDPGETVVSSHLEHHAVVRPLRKLERERGVVWEKAPYFPGTPIDLSFVESTLARGRTRLVAVSAASNVTGELLPLAELAGLAHRHGARLLVDAAQAVGIVDLDYPKIGADIVTFAGHKGPLGPQGLGGLWAGPDVAFRCPAAVCEIPPVGAGSAPGALAAFPGYCDVGGLNVAGVAGLSAGLGWLTTQTGRVETARQLAAELAEELRRRPGYTVFGHHGGDQTALVSFVSEALALDRAESLLRSRGILVRAGQHCAPDAAVAVGAPEGTIRASFGVFSTREDLRRLVAVLDELARK